MAKPNVKGEDVLKAIELLKNNDVLVPYQNQSTGYDLVINGQKYPPKFVVALAYQLANGVNASEFVTTFNTDEARSTLEEALKDVLGENEFAIVKKANNDFSSKDYPAILISSKNVILRGAPGTGKTYLAKEIAAEVVSDGKAKKYAQLTDDQLKQIEFVQFHPNYDYSDFVEGLRPKINEDGSMGFELQDGIFKKFVARARKDLEESPDNPKQYVFIIDEINRGEISKIFGELFFSIDPGYRGVDGAVSTQYSNLHSDSDEKFYIPDNVYIIGTMNDIDRSVDSFDFAMRRRFRFIELGADENVAMLEALEEDVRKKAVKKMKALNEEIVKNEDLNENYQIGASYFLKLNSLDNNFDELWADHLQPLLQDYVQGMYDEKGILKKFKDAYEGEGSSVSDENETLQD